ncbi:hypothetical protein JCM16358_21190 [Halanaerocella petrolearia]
MLKKVVAFTLLISIVCFLFILPGIKMVDSNVNYQLLVNNHLFNRVINYWLGIIELDNFHSKFILQEGLPVVRVNNQLLESDSDKVSNIVNYSCEFITGVPLSFFKVKDKQERPAKPVVSQPQIKVNMKDEVEDKLKAEGRHNNEENHRVKLDFWQTESNIQSDENRLKNKPEDTLAPKRDNKSESLEPTRVKGNLVGIYHTHTSENYENKGYNAHAPAGERGDVVQIGDYLADRLKNKYQIPVIHSTRVNDTTYARSYINSLHTAKGMVRDNPNLEMVFDIHRDAIAKGGRDLLTTQINGQQVATVMIIVTNNNYGLPHPEWKKNLKFAKRLGSKMESMYPGLLREVELVSNRRYNQHIHPHALLLEVGGAKNTIPEARRSAQLLADVLASLIKEGG